LSLLSQLFLLCLRSHRATWLPAWRLAGGAPARSLPPLECRRLRPGASRENLPFPFDGRIIMDIQRSILIVALAVVSYLMVLQWNEDYGQAALPAEVRTSTAATPTLPDTPAATASTGSDD